MSQSVHFDVIIAGAGSAGCVLANRLTEDAACRVLLIEAGPDFPTVESLPRDIAEGLDVGQSQDWGYRSEPGAAIAGRSIPLLRGKLTGGCSAINVTFSMRGWPDDYDGWASIGNKGWSFSDVLPYFRKLETDHDYSNKWHGQTGPHPIRRQRELSESHQRFVEACEVLGHRRIEDHNQPGEIGIGPAPVNTVDGVRRSTALTYLAQARSRPNLSVLPNTTVDRVVFEGARAAGVLTGDGQVLAGDQIVLAAGSYASPAILMRSGIGQPAEMSRIGIDAHVELPGVGAELIEHPLIGIVFHTYSVLPPDLPGLQTMLAIDQGEYRFQVFPWHQPSGSPESPDVFAIVGALLNPRSRGKLRVGSGSSDASPLIDLQLLGDERDVAGVVELVRTIWRISQAQSLRDILRPAMIDDWVERDDEKVETFVREIVEVYNHPVATCRMGGDGLAVVDQQGRVHGVRGLRVIDASIIPVPLTAQTNLSTIMIAEKLAEHLAA